MTDCSAEQVEGHVYTLHLPGNIRAFGFDPSECAVCWGQHPGAEPGEWVSTEERKGS